MNSAQRDAKVTDIIAKLIGYTWKSGQWYRKDIPVTDYFDPMNDETTAKTLAEEFNIEVFQNAHQTYTAETPDPNDPHKKLWVSCSTKEAATSYLVCMLAGENPEAWEVQ